ncbi:hypothetical protein BKH43_03370 [Helicobacter sp. 13S00401-1]|uniref:outer membrane beta-barrel protein n=1 Tax=Helicobacter sp. 13S00401-1 TaxID=1905758 RepID=UPI000BA762BC|nr:outer membrane beta-barrel protein [Helicobacter sp. 13S00401-1]PAF50910.1 hypothetical protein BKH43_03370 [Helicobacter sp. 13S00401-1]
MKKEKSLLVLLGVGVVSSLFFSSAVYAKSGVFVGINAGLPITSTDYELKPNYQHFKDQLPTSGIGYSLGAEIGYKQELSKRFGVRVYASYNFSQSYGKKKSSETDPLLPLAVAFANKLDSTGTLGTLTSSGLESKSSVKTDTNLNATLTNHLAAANIDFTFNATRYLGFFLGMGIGADFYSGAYQYDAHATPSVFLTSLGQTGLAAFASAYPQLKTLQEPSEHKGSINGATAVGLALPLNVGVNLDLGSSTISLGAKIPLLATTMNIQGPSDQSEDNSPSTSYGAINLKNYILQAGYSYTF